MSTLEEYLQMAENNSLEDFHLKLWLECQIVKIFKDDSRKPFWDVLFNELENVGINRNPIFEATYNFGLWKRDNDYKKALFSGEKYVESAHLSKEKKWWWLLTYSFQEAIFVYSQLNDKNKLKLISKEIVDCLQGIENEAKDHTLIELLKLFCKCLYVSDRKDIEKMLNLSKKLAFKQRDGDYFSFQQSFIDLAIEIAKHLSRDEEVKNLQEDYLQSILNEAEFKGKSLLVKKKFLEDALKYCSDKIGDGTKIRNLKTQIKELDISSELRKIRLPKELQDNPPLL